MGLQCTHLREHHVMRYPAEGKGRRLLLITADNVTRVPNPSDTTTIFHHLLYNIICGCINLSHIRQVVGLKKWRFGQNLALSSQMDCTLHSSSNSHLDSIPMGYKRAETATLSDAVACVVQQTDCDRRKAQPRKPRLVGLYQKPFQGHYVRFVKLYAQHNP